METTVKAPWIKQLGSIPATLTYSSRTMFGEVAQFAERRPDYIACEFLGSRLTYAALAALIRRTGAALRALGVMPGDRVTICMPNTPQAVAAFYAVNLAGGVANMVHPLSSEPEMEFYLTESKSRVCIGFDQSYEKLLAACRAAGVDELVLASARDGLTPLKKLGYDLTQKKKAPCPKRDVFGGAHPHVQNWRTFLAGGKGQSDEPAPRKPEDPAVILYSGGTTGVTKGILLSNRNFNALAAQIVATNPMFSPGDRMLAVMPLFHGFGLGVCIHSMLASGGDALLIPRFNAASYADLLKKQRPNFIAGVPTLYEALLRTSRLEGVKLDCLKGVFSGGDSLPPDLKRRFDAFLKQHGATIQIREGYGTTECVTASCLTPPDSYREGSIGLPFPDTYYKIVGPGTEEAVPYGEEGEICLSGPTVMLGYLDRPEETADTLRRHADGLTWVHTGDLGTMDSDGYVYFRQRLKRMIVTSGYNVYPTQLESVIDAHPKVNLSCVIGVPDPVRVQKVKAFIVPADGVAPSEELRRELDAYCREKIARYAIPREFEFRTSLPTTLVGKVAYRVLEEEEAGKPKTEN